ncbi:hypothetical protein VDG1235_1116 [Verrucomicrobiia bacterium DG1235]|nr:hypothetical protein VDG1235_1116 [Verrucomicrobiae bacterium DG1235]
MPLPFTRSIGRKLASYLSQPSQRGVRVATCSVNELAKTLKKGDVLLVEGRSRFSIAIKYLTQSTWSHAALYIGDAVDEDPENPASKTLLEADIIDGVRLSPLNIYADTHTRICRPSGLSSAEIDSLIAYSMTRLGNSYDLKNIFDLARYLIQKPPVPNKWRRKLLAIGSGDPTRAICSSLIAETFHTIKYPILPEFRVDGERTPHGTIVYEEQAHIRHHSLFAPGDFDLSPYFDIIKPTLACGFDPHEIKWNESEFTHPKPS